MAPSRPRLSELSASTRIVLTHPANQGRRLRQLATAGRHQFERRVRGRRIQVPIGTHGGMIWSEPDHPGGGYVLYANTPDWPHMLVWEKHLKPEDLFVDVGANIGTYAVFCQSLGADVIALEPAAETAAYLRRNNSLNGGGIEVVEAAVGDHVGVAHFTSGQNEQNRVDPAGEEIVPLTTLDAIIGERTVAGVKLDVEGFELEALRGASEALGEHRIRLLQIEWNDLAPREPVADLLASFGYQMFRPTNQGELVAVQPRRPGADLFAAAPGVVPDRQRTKVALFTAFAPDIGGGAALLRSLLPELGDLDLTWYYLAAEESALGTGEWLGPPPSSRVFIGDLLARAMHRPGSAEISKLVDRLDADVSWVVTHNEGVSVAAELIDRGRKVHVSVHDDPEAVFARSRKYRFFGPLISEVFRKVLRGSSTVDVITPGMQRWYRREYGVDSTIVYRFAPSLPDVADESGDDELRVGHIGHLYDPQPFRCFLRACLELATIEHRPFKIVTVGTSPYLGEIEAENPSVFERHGQMEEEGAIRVLASCHFLYAMYPDGRRFLRFRQTSIPMKLSTYILAQRPIFAHTPTDSTLAEAVGRYGLGTVCASNDASIITQSIRNVLASSTDATVFEAARTDLLGSAQICDLRAALHQ